MAESPIDFAGLDAAASAAEVTPAVDSAVVEETPVVETKVDDTKIDTKVEEKTPELNEDGTPKVAEAKAEDLPGDAKTPQEVRAALKAFRDANPANAAATKLLHGSYERWEAAKAIYPGGVSEMKAAKEFMDLVGGHEGYETLKSTVDSISESDQLLYAGDPKLLDNIVEDLKSEGKLDALGKLAPSFLDKVRATDEKAYFSTIMPHIAEQLKEANLPGALSGLFKALADPDPAKAVSAAKAVAEDMQNWYKDIETKAKPKEDPLTPERQKLNEERAAFQKQQEEFKTNQTTEFKNSVASVCEKANNKLLGTELKDYLRMPFFKGFGRENLMPLGNTIKANLFAELKADKAYQAQMKAMWAAKTPDRAKIEEYHNARVQSISARIVRDTVQTLYPGYAKGGAAAGRVAAAAEKKTAQGKVEQKAVADGKPIFVGKKPAREEIDKTRDPKDYLEIAGRAYLKNGKFVSWRR